MPTEMQSRKRMRWIRLLTFLVYFPGMLFSQVRMDSTVSPVRTKPLRIAAISTGAAYALGLAGLNHLWYRHSERQSFRFFNDNPEWNQVDKLGHFYSSFYLSNGFSKGLQHYNVKPSRADLAGSIIGFAVLIPIEIFDGFSDAYGASVGDLVADGAGALFYYSQSNLWNEVRLRPKFSFRYSPYAKMRPDVLGEGMERIIKDYNGQTYWLSVDADKFFRFPKWLNFAVGYGANGMIYARDSQHIANGLSLPQRQYFLSIDLDASAIHTRSKVVKTIIFVVSMIKLPAPTLEFSGNRVKAHAFYF
jgi:hypothetical protein